MMKRIMILLLLAALLASCGGGALSRLSGGGEGGTMPPVPGRWDSVTATATETYLGTVVIEVTNNSKYTVVAELTMRWHGDGYSWHESETITVSPRSSASVSMTIPAAVYRGWHFMGARVTAAW